MSENQNRRIEERAKFEAMTTEELESILRLDMDAPREQESDTETLLAVMEVLAERRKAGHTGKTALEAYESFKQHYMPEIDHTEPVPERKKKTSNITPVRWLRALTAAAAVVVILLVGSVTAKAFGFDVWEAVVKWTEETFHISIGDPRDTDEPGENDALPYASLEEALQKGEANPLVVPSWIPDGFELGDLTIEHTPKQKIYSAIYCRGNDTLRLSVFHYLNSYPEYIEQSEGYVETYEASGVKYYLFENNKRVQAVWINGSYECHILGDLTIDELKLMIDSIGKG